jgi:hypothetical protein
VDAPEALVHPASSGITLDGSLYSDQACMHPACIVNAEAPPCPLTVHVVTWNLGKHAPPAPDILSQIILPNGDALQPDILVVCAQECTFEVDHGRKDDEKKEEQKDTGTGCSHFACLFWCTCAQLF